jgi:hypothetical protein
MFLLSRMCSGDYSSAAMAGLTIAYKNFGIGGFRGSPAVRVRAWLIGTVALIAQPRAGQQVFDSPDHCLQSRITVPFYRNPAG